MESGHIALHCADKIHHPLAVALTPIARRQSRIRAGGGIGDTIPIGGDNLGIAASE
ncbi:MULTISPECIES: hypothetical protein [Nocardia]|jgi:hypothetical protein|uniref:Uncharacterized protein n=1 Tax=Nocardia elegans TaxID=300029 RepID=A0ABW6TNL6_9NOCA|nr:MULTISPECIES: hypothetical protein [Nocardia]